LTGQVPFKGVNGPSILLEILTKEPVAPSQVASAAKADIPRGIDDALLRAMKKVVGLRTASVGQLADELGRGYGLSGDHRSWAVTAEAELRQQIAVRLRALMDNTTAVRSQVSTTDAFFGEREGLGISLSPPASPSHRAGALGPAGPPALAGVSGPPSSFHVPAKRPWLAPVLVAATALLAGVVLSLIFI
jgi:hypothetical protein